MHAIEQALAEYQLTLSYDEALELGVSGRHCNKIGLRVAKSKQDDSAPGLEVIEAYSGYPFARASVQSGDRILKVAHRQPETVMSIYNILSNFLPGTSVPVLIERDSRQLEGELVVELAGSKRLQSCLRAAQPDSNGELPGEENVIEFRENMLLKQVAER